MADRLFKPIKVGNSLLKSRVVMAPLTRFRADKDHNVSEHAKEYYEQRASVPGTLLITEATFVSAQAGGYPNIPGIWSETQIAGWKDVVDAVHKKGSFIYLQLWGLGRVAQDKVLQEEGGWKVRSASAIAVPAEQTSTGKAGTTPDAMTEDEIHEFINDYARGAANAIEAGFDGVEIHGKKSHHSSTESALIDFLQAPMAISSISSGKMSAISEQMLGVAASKSAQNSASK